MTPRCTVSPTSVTQALEVRPRDALEVDLGSQRRGRAGGSCPSGDIAAYVSLLGDVAGLDERAEEAGDGGLVEADLLGDRRRPKPDLVRRGQRLEDIESTTERSGDHVCRSVDNPGNRDPRVRPVIDPSRDIAAARRRTPSPLIRRRGTP